MASLISVRFGVNSILIHKQISLGGLNLELRYLCLPLFVRDVKPCLLRFLRESNSESICFCFKLIFEWKSLLSLFNSLSIETEIKKIIILNYIILFEIKLITFTILLN